MDTFEAITAVLIELSTHAPRLLQFLTDTSLSFGVQAGCDPCPASQFTEIGAAWANIGYMTHSDMLHFVSETKFGLWAVLLYAAAAIGALVGVAIGQPPRTYMWFMLGPAIYSFLIGTTQEVRGVEWTVAGRAQDMKAVWRDAEAGLKNTRLTRTRNIVRIDGDNGPTGNYPVATGLLFLDELFSASTNLAVEWLGLYDQDGEGSANSNLAGLEQGQPEGPWYILSDLKWGFIENIVGNTVRTAALRDALVTFIGSECGDSFKTVISDGSYAAAAQSKGAVFPTSVFQDNAPDFDGRNLPPPNYAAAMASFKGVSMPTPSGLVKVISDDGRRGGFAKFSRTYDIETNIDAPGQNLKQNLNCLDYLLTIIHGFRWESGHAYHQLLRASPQGLDVDKFTRALLYGWNVRNADGSEVASAEERIAFLKGLILAYLIRNELTLAPQITNADLRYAPSDQAKSFSNAFVRTSGSKSKFAEIYQWAVLMPHLQGLLLYFLIIAYPFACMVMVLPGYWKAFFTWVAFFAWAKLWDVGFAMVYILERSVWAMIGNHSNMGRVGNMILQTMRNNGGVGVDCDSDSAQANRAVLGAISGGSTGGVGGALGGFQNGARPALLEADLSKICAIPRVCSVDGLQQACSLGGGSELADSKALRTFDSALIVGASADLDLSNGYYMYIMAALYLAVPAVTGQMVLGAKAGAASMVTGGISGVTADAGRAAQTGYQGAAVNQAQTNQASLGQAAYAKAMRAGQPGGSFASQIMTAGNEGIQSDLASAEMEGRQKSLQAQASALGTLAGDRKSAMNANMAGVKVAANASEYAGLNSSLKGLFGGDKKGKGGDENGSSAGVLGAAADWGNQLGQYGADHKSNRAAIAAAGGGLDTHYDTSMQQMRKAAGGAVANRLGEAAEYQAQMAAWEAKNSFGAHASSVAGIAGMNAGNLNPGQKPTNLGGMAFSGQLNTGGDNSTQRAAMYPLSFYGEAMQSLNSQKGTFGSSSLDKHFGSGYSLTGAWGNSAGAFGANAANGVLPSSLAEGVGDFKDGAGRGKQEILDSNGDLGLIK
jgi:hypothetical protein